MGHIHGLAGVDARLQSTLLQPTVQAGCLPSSRTLHPGKRQVPMPAASTSPHNSIKQPVQGVGAHRFSSHYSKAHSYQRASWRIDSLQLRKNSPADFALTD